MFKIILNNSKTTCVCVTGLLILSIFIFMPISYANPITSDEKLEFALKIEQISGHMISALDSINQKEYSLAKMHLMHPSAMHSNIIDFFPEDSVCFKKLPLALMILQSTIPEYDGQDINQRFSYIFEVLNDCRSVIIDADDDSNLQFNINLIEELLKKSISERTFSEESYGITSTMKSQDALSLVMQAHIHVKSTEIFDKIDSDNISQNFIKLLVAHMDKSPLDEIIFLTHSLRDEIKLLDDITNHESNAEHTFLPSIIFLKSTNYSTDLILLELRGENFDNNQKIKIEYFSLTKKQFEIINSNTTSDGEFHIPLEIVNSSFDGSILFLITIGDVEFSKILSISETP